MKNGFWGNLKRPVFVLAPMADVTDTAFRRLIASKGKPGAFWTEFVSADGLALAPEEGRRKLMLDLIYTEGEKPVVAQFFTSSPENMKKAAKLAKKLGFDGIDINMGCPDRSVEKQGAGAALIKSPARARELIRAAKEGAGGLPVSVKTRIGYNKVELEAWLPEILKEEPALVTIHARTRKDMSKVPARWEFVKRAVEIRNEMGSPVLIFGNGDVMSIDEARKRVEETGCDGVMLGRAIFGNPWLFNEGYIPELKERLETLIEHISLYDELLMKAEYGAKSFAIMKKHFKAYVSGFNGAGELRHLLMESQSPDDAILILREFTAKLPQAGQ